MRLTQQLMLKRHLWYRLTTAVVDAKNCYDAEKGPYVSSPRHRWTRSQDQTHSPVTAGRPGETAVRKRLRTDFRPGHRRSCNLKSGNLLRPLPRQVCLAGMP